MAASRWLAALALDWSGLNPVMTARIGNSRGVRGVRPESPTRIRSWDPSGSSTMWGFSQQALGRAAKPRGFASKLRSDAPVPEKKGDAGREAGRRPEPIHYKIGMTPAEKVVVMQLFAGCGGSCRAWG